VKILAKYFLMLVLILFGVSFFVTPSSFAGSDKVITFGAPMSLTGQNSVNGRHARKGYQLAKSMINENGGIDIGGVKYQIAVKYYDDESNPAIAAKFAKRLITKDKVAFLLGPYGTNTTAAVAPVAEKY